MTLHHKDCDSAAKKILERVGNNINLGVPLGIGKPIGFLNAIYRLAIENPAIQLTIMTGLTLTRPKFHQELEKRLAEPIVARILGNYEDPLYELARQQQKLPANIKIIEFFLAPGKYLTNPNAQQDYISAHYANAARDVVNQSINVIAQQVTRSKIDASSYSLSCNTDLFHETLNELAAQNKHISVVAEVNLNLPFMLGNAIVQEEIFTDVIDTKKYHSLFAVPKPKLSTQDHLIGLYSTTLIKDDGGLQIGIGKLGDAITHSLILRHKENATYLNVLDELRVFDKFPEIIAQDGAVAPFDYGLYAPTEMLSDDYLHLYHEKILKKRVYDHLGLQLLLNNKQITEKITPKWLDILVEHKIINLQLTEADFNFLQKFGILRDDILFQDGHLVLSTGEVIAADLVKSKHNLEKCLGKFLKSGKLLHAGFFLGSKDFYHQLHDLSHEERLQFEMTSIKHTNSLLWNYDLAAAQRQHVRFINAAMMVTVEGSIISDGLKNWQEVSGVGGQFDFAMMAQNLPTARFIINCHSTRKQKGKYHSNILWEYPNSTLDRHLRDVIVTEYGIADCRSKTDSEVIEAILNVTDSRFQNSLLTTAKKWGKIAANYEIPKLFQNNYPEKIEPIVNEFRMRGYFHFYPFGSELTELEETIQEALLFLQHSNKLKLFFLSMTFFQSDDRYLPCLQRMQLAQPKTVKDFIYKKLLKYALSRKSHVTPAKAN